MAIQLPSAQGSYQGISPPAPPGEQLLQLFGPDPGGGRSPYSAAIMWLQQFVNQTPNSSVVL